MKCRILFFVILLLGLSVINLAYSQTPPPALGQANFPAIGDTVSLIEYTIPIAVRFTVRDTSPKKNDTVSIDRSLMKALNNLGDTSFYNIGFQTGYQNWAFSLPLYRDYGVNTGHHYKKAKGAPGSGNYPTANIYFPTDTNNNYFLNSSTGYYSMGIWSSASSNFVNATGFPVVKYPVTYSKPINYPHTKLSSTITSGGSVLPIISSLDVKVQAYGKISIDTSSTEIPKIVTYDSCFLVVSHEMDSVNYASVIAGGWAWTDYKIYSIYSPKFKEPVVSFQYFKNRNNLFSVWSSYPQYKWNDFFTASYTISSGLLVPVTGLFISPMDTTVSKGASFTIMAALTPENAYPSKITWKTSNGAYATVDQNGKVNCIRKGSAVITATAPGGHFFATCNITITTGINDLENESAFKLNCYPNPFTNVTNISYELTANSHVNISIYNLLGNIVSNPVDAKMSKGKHQLRFDAADLPAGLYLCRIIAGDKSETSRLMLIK